MIRITIVPKNKKPLNCFIDQETHTLKTNINILNKKFSILKICQPCITNIENKHCEFINSLMPIIVYFSDITSHEEVTFHYRDGKTTTFFSDTASNIAFTAFVFASFYSPCRFFNKFNFLLKYYPPRIAPDIYMHLALTTALFSRHENFKSSGLVSILSILNRHNKELQKRLLKLLEVSKLIIKNDATLNAIVIAYELSILSQDDIEQYYQEFLDHIHGLA
jgi:hypothetical protein